MSERVIKFRAWDARNKRFGYTTIHANKIDWPTDLWVSQSKEGCGVKFIDVVDWQQFTGLHDRNGKEIFEGDICKTNYGIAKVKFSERGGSFVWDIGPGTYITDAFRDHKDENIVLVIGNIYQNPDLLTPPKEPVK